MNTFVFNRQVAIEALVARDGYSCQYPDCDLPFDEGRYMLTLDHKYPQFLARQAGWTEEQIWDHDNLQLMHKCCNAKKGHLTYDEDGNLPVRENNRTHKAERAPVCQLCESGRLLFVGERCDLCGSGPQPAAFPKYAQKTPKECSHGFDNPEDHCWMCVVGFVERKPAVNVIIEGP